MNTYKIEPVHEDIYRMETSTGDTTLTSIIRFCDIPGVVRRLDQTGYRAEKIEWHCCER